MELTNGILSLEFDPKTGSLVGIENRRLRSRHEFDPAYARLFRVTVPDEERWIDRYADSHESGRPRMKLGSGQLTIHYPDLRTPEKESTGISATVTVTLPEGADEARFEIEIANGGPFLVHEVRFPWIGGWTGCAGPGRDRLTAGQYMLDPHEMHTRGGSFGRGWTIYGQHRRWAVNHINMMVPMLDLSGGGRGISMVPYPSAPSLQYAVAEDLNRRPGDTRLGVGWIHHAFARPGGSWTSYPVGLAAHRGDWHETADRLRGWLATWWRPPESPRRLRRAIGFHNVMFRDFCGRVLRPLSDLPKIARHGLALGLRDICVWDMALMGVYMHAGSAATLEDDPARVEELSRALKATAALGVEPSALINTRLVTMKNRLGRELSDRWMVRTLYGTPAVESYPLRGAHGKLMTDYLDEFGHRLCQCNPEFQDWALDTVERCRGLGFTSIFLDEPFGEDLCFAANHGHAVPGHTAEGVADWTARASRAVRSGHPGSYTIGESLDIWTSRGIDLGWYWNWSDHHAEVFRYVLPESLQAWTIDAHEHEDEVGKAFALGFLLALDVDGLAGTLRDVPEFCGRIKALSDLRERTAGFTVEGRFVDNVGLGVDTGASVVSGLYDAGDRLGIVLGETSKGEKGGGAVGLRLDLDRYGRKKAKAVRLYGQDGSVKELRPAQSDGTLHIDTRLGKWECAAIEVE